eukprot:GFKZ01001563.1.p1 GENE.GFKZ01001563.1~~GFKZ01001563.1.p1  ORF type:complete len:133 (+),score=8.60 GFKZ01001563.1:661-1059(+)
MRNSWQPSDRPVVFLHANKQFFGKQDHSNLTLCAEPLPDALLSCRATQRRTVQNFPSSLLSPFLPVSQSKSVATGVGCIARLYLLRSLHVLKTIMLLPNRKSRDDVEGGCFSRNRVYMPIKFLPSCSFLSTL